LSSREKGIQQRKKGLACVWMRCAPAEAEESARAVYKREVADKGGINRQ
jgi:hypothetical protein